MQVKIQVAAAIEPVLAYLRARAWLLLLLSSLLYACGIDAGDDPARPDGPADGEPETPAISIDGFDLQPYLQSAFACLRRRDTGHHLFHGCIDWHSAVHAHWAVLRHANRRGAGDESDFVVERLRSPALALERDFMNSAPGFEMPYGRAWFLALALEYEALTGDDRLQAMAGEIAASLRAFLDAGAIDPLRRSYGNHGWALAQLLRYYRARGDADGIAWVEARVDDHYRAYDPRAALAIDRDRPDFFSLWGNWALLLGLRDPAALRAWLDQQVIDADALAPIARPLSAHHLGMNPSRSWGLWWAFAVTADARFERALAEHLAQIDRTFATSGDDYFAYGHWVPQFVIHAATQAR